MIYKYGFKINPVKHIKLFLSCIIISIFSMIISDFIRSYFMNLFNIDMDKIVGFLVNVFLTLFIITIITLILYLLRKDFRELFKYIKNIFIAQ